MAACTRGQILHHQNILRIADISEPDKFNPLLSTMDLTEHLSALVFSTLVIAGDKGHIIGDLATGVPTLANGGISVDGKTILYHLRHGVTWHDGKPFTSRDVAFTWRLVMNPRNNVFFREAYEVVDRIDTPDDWTVVVHLKHRWPPFVTRFFTSLQEGAKVILPEHLLAGEATINQSPFNAKPIGTGPFKFVRWERGRGIELAANENYFRGRPKLDGIRFIEIPDENTMLNETRAGDVDLPSVSSNSLPFYKSIPGVVTELWPWNAETVLALNDSRTGLRHVEVRQAIVRAIDFNAVIAKITHGVDAIAHDIVPPTAIGYVDNPPYPYDPAAARRLLEQNGWKLGSDGVRKKGDERLEFTFYSVTGSASARAIAVQLQAWFRAIGIALDIKESPYDQIFSYDGPVQTGKYDMATWGYTLPWDPDNLVYLGCDRVPPKGENVFRFCDRQIDDGERRGLQSDDPRERTRVYAQVERRIREMVPYIPLYLARRPEAHIAALKNFRPAPTITAWWNAWEWSLSP
ncbi:MAG: ABC transporter substrate-binding protein [Vulcanimicrobiaceae bacterium]